MGRLSRKLIKSTITKDLYIILVVNCILLFVFIDIDALEWLHSYASQHEDYELDEILLLFASLGFSFVIFAFRRWKEGHNLIKEVENIAIRDGLTELYNRSYMLDDIIEESKRTKRSGIPFSLLMIDIDHFKKINDNFGHDIGDDVLVNISKLFKNNCREIDVVARWGGEEFIILCPQTDIKGAIKFGKKIIDSVNKLQVKEVKQISVSIGVTDFFSDTDDHLSVLKRVDNCLYEAKNTGRNKLVSSDNSTGN